MQRIAIAVVGFTRQMLLVVVRARRTLKSTEARSRGIDIIGLLLLLRLAIGLFYPLRMIDQD